MRSHRLSRLAVLTQGVALVGFGLAELACSKEPNVNGPVKEGPHINAPPDKPMPSSSAPEPPHVNAPIAQGTSAPSASAAAPSASTAPSAAPSAKPAKK